MGTGARAGRAARHAISCSPRTRRDSSTSSAVRCADGGRSSRAGASRQSWGQATGVSALFAGESGTGKTLAAEVVARELRSELFRVDLAGMVSKYIGETEKNLEQVFTAAASSDAILLFDEADALFGKRSEVRDAHDRYANIEVSYLLQRMEACSGLALLATNLRANLDPAFTRRLGFIVHFRSRVMQAGSGSGGVSGRRVPLADDIDLEFLADRFPLAGEHIKHTVLAAAYSAAAGSAITMADLLATTG
jgi:SpoVK/Ycf46/Vps4 family AAA+-type ATPase